MHGLIMDEIRRYVEAKLGRQTWQQLLDASGAQVRVYQPMLDYPDSETLALVSTASKMTGIAIPDLLEDFGEFIVPDLVSMCRILIKSEWTALDFLEHVEEMIHELVRRNWRVKPPALSVRRTRPEEVIITYTSRRRMCHVARGIVKGVGRQYGEEVVIAEPSCMLRDDPQCVIAVRSMKAWRSAPR